MKAVTMFSQTHKTVIDRNVLLRKQAVNNVHTINSIGVV